MNSPLIFILNTMHYRLEITNNVEEIDDCIYHHHWTNQEISII